VMGPQGPKDQESKDRVRGSQARRERIPAFRIRAARRADAECWIHNAPGVDRSVDLGGVAGAQQNLDNCIGKSGNKHLMDARSSASPGWLLQHQAASDCRLMVRWLNWDWDWMWRFY